MFVSCLTSSDLDHLKFAIVQACLVIYRRYLHLQIGRRHHLCHCCCRISSCTWIFLLTSGSLDLSFSSAGQVDLSFCSHWVLKHRQGSPNFKDDSILILVLQLSYCRKHLHILYTEYCEVIPDIELHACDLQDLLVFHLSVHGYCSVSFLSGYE